MIWIVLLTIIIILLIYHNYNLQQYWKKRSIPYIKTWPIFGNFTKTVFQRISFIDLLQEFYYHSPDEKIVGIHQFNSPLLFVRDPELIKLVTIKHFDNFINHKTFIGEDIEPLFGRNLMALKDQKWKDMRSTLSPAFTGSKMRAMYPLIKDCAEYFTNYFLKEVEQEKNILDVEMKDILTRYTNDVIASTAFGIKCDSLRDRTNDFFVNGQKSTKFTFRATLIMMGYIFMRPIMEFFKVTLFGKSITEFFRNIIKSNIQEREEKGIIRPDMIHLLMEARKGKLKYELNSQVDGEGFAVVEESNIGKDINKDPPTLTDDDIAAQALIFFFAGYETTSTTISFLSYELATNPDIQEKLYEEIKETMERCNGNISYEALLKMKYLDMVVCEGLRKWPTAIVTERLCENDYTIESDGKSYTIDQGVSFWIPLYCIHHDPKYFPNPEKFDPERFSDENKLNILPNTYIPFGIGPRNCIGSRFALLEMKILCATLLSKFELTVTKKTEIPLKPGKKQFNILPQNGFWLGLKPRQ